MNKIMSVFWHWFETVSNYVDKFCQAFGVSILVCMWGLLVINALARWTEVTNIAWSQEIVGYMIAWSLFVMLGPVTRADEHIKVSFIPERLFGKERGATFMFALESLVGLCLSLLICVNAYNLIIFSKNNSGVKPSSGGDFGYPFWITRSGVLLGFSLSSLFYLERTIKWLRQLFTGNKMATASDNPMLNTVPVGEDTPQGQQFSAQEGK